MSVETTLLLVRPKYMFLRDYDQTLYEKATGNVIKVVMLSTSIVHLWHLSIFNTSPLVNVHSSVNNTCVKINKQLHVGLMHR